MVCRHGDSPRKIFTPIYHSIQAGLYNRAKDLIDVAVCLEQEHLGSRPERMVELYALLAELYDEVSLTMLNKLGK